MLAWSSAESRRVAARTPRGTANSTVSSVDRPAMLSVTGNRSAITAATGFSKKIDLPKSPLSALGSQFRY